MLRYHAAYSLHRKIYFATGVIVHIINSANSNEMNPESEFPINS